MGPRRVVGGLFPSKVCPVLDRFSRSMLPINLIVMSSSQKYSVYTPSTPDSSLVSIFLCTLLVPLIFYLHKGQLLLVPRADFPPTQKKGL